MRASPSTTSSASTGRLRAVPGPMNGTTGKRRVDLVSFFILRTESDEQPWNRSELSLIPFPTYEIFEEQLRSFDLVVFQNFNYAPYGVEPFLSNVRDYVEGGGALAMRSEEHT